MRCAEEKKSNGPAHPFVSTAAATRGAQVSTTLEEEEEEEEEKENNNNKERLCSASYSTCRCVFVSVSLLCHVRACVYACLVSFTSSPHCFLSFL
jgi:hypothetical protein